METVQIFHHYRPVRVAYAAQFYDKQQLLDAVNRATLVAGGMYNPILPMGIDDAIVENLIRTFNPDVVENLTGNKIDFLDKQTHLEWPRLGVQSTYSNDKNGATVNLLDVSHKMQEIYENNARDKGQNNCVLPVWEANNPRALFLAFEFGKYPVLNKRDFEAAFLHYLEADEVTLENGATVDPKLYDRYTPIHLTAHDMRLVSGGFGESDNGYYIGYYDDPMDLVNYWNLRAYGKNLIFIEADKAGLDVIEHNNQRDQDRSAPPRGVYRSVWYRTELKRDFITDYLKDAINTPMLHEIPAGYWTGGYSNNAVRPQYESNKNVLAQLEITDNRKQLVFQMPQPPVYKANGYRLPQAVISCVKTFGFYSQNNRHLLEPPAIPGLTSWAAYQLSSHMHGVRLRVGELHLITDTNDSIESLSLIHYDDLFSEIFKLSDLSIERSAPGQLADKLIDHMGGVDSCRIFKVKGVRNLLNGMKVDQSIPWSGAIDKIRDVDLTGKASFDDYKDLYIQQRDTKNLSAQECMDFLITNNLMRAGYNLKCENCGLSFWVNLTQANDYVECEFCYKQVHMAVQIRSRGDIAYRRSGLFGKNNNLEGSVPVALTLMALTRLGGMHDAPFATARKIKSKAAGIDCETDFIVLGRDSERGSDVVIGECKTNMPITRQDVENLLKVKKQLDSNDVTTYISFTKLSPFTADEISLFKEMDDAGACPILFTEKEVAPYNLYFNFDKSELEVPHPFSAHDLARNSKKLYLS